MIALYQCYLPGFDSYVWLNRRCPCFQAIYGEIFKDNGAIFMQFILKWFKNAG
jgi:hypothetical protein